MTSVSVRVRDFMLTDPLTVAPDTEIRRVLRLLIEHDVSGAPVVDAEGLVLGIVTERDCIAVAVEAGYFGEWGGPVSKYMSAPAETVAPGDSLVDVATRMAKSPYRRFPVVEDGRLVGMLGRREVLRAINRG